MKPGHNRRTSWVLLAVAAGLLALGGCDRVQALLHGNRCVLSDRPLHAAMAVEVAVEGGKRGEACCVRCAITYSQQTGRKVRVLWVTDYASGHRIDPRHATYVTGSDVNRCMGPAQEASPARLGSEAVVWDRCSPSSIAFAKPADAQAFQQIHGGRIQTFAQVIGTAKVITSR
jgi:nitrous oxide reductase accessory protein NosL